MTITQQEADDTQEVAREEQKNARAMSKRIFDGLAKRAAENSLELRRLRRRSGLIHGVVKKIT